MGKPSLVKVQEPIKFKVLFGGKEPDLDLMPILQDKLFLQRLNDTRQVLQEKINTKNFLSNFPKPLPWDMDQWPLQITNNLIPLNVLDSGKSIASDYWGRRIYDCWDYSGQVEQLYPFAYWVTLEIKANYLNQIKIPQLFNFIHWMPSIKRYNLHFHSVYLHKQDWKDFRFMQISDMHISFRNDYIKSEVQKSKPDSANCFINWNQNFRNFICYANSAHRQENPDLHLDFLLITGDLVDYLEIKRKFTNDRTPLNNIEYFRDIITAWKSDECVIVDQELEIPIFTILGNHDYRPAEYPLIGRCRYDPMGYTWDQEFISEYKCFGLTMDEAIEYMKSEAPDFYKGDDIDGVKVPPNKVPDYTADEGINFVSHYPEAPLYYRYLINPDVDYWVDLGKHRLICLNSGPDQDQLGGDDDFAKTNPIVDAACRQTKSRRIFKNHNTDSEGFYQSQINLLNDSCSINGIKIVAFHNPIVWFREQLVPHLFRETEHEKLNADDKFWLFMYLCNINQMEPYYSIAMGKITSFENNNKIMVEILLGNYEFDETTGERGFKINNSYILDNFSDDLALGDLIWTDKVIGGKWRKIEFVLDWSFRNDKYFRRGCRDHYFFATKYRKYVVPENDYVIGVGDGVPAFCHGGFQDPGNFDGFMQVITDKKVDLILTGHTDSCVEFIIKNDEEGQHTFYHDYYVDGKYKGKDPKDIWGAGTPDYEHPLNKNDIAKQKWWNEHRTLCIVAPALDVPSLKEPMLTDNSYSELKANYSHYIKSTDINDDVFDWISNNEVVEGMGAIRVNVKRDEISSIDRIYFGIRFSYSLVGFANGKGYHYPISLKKLAANILPGNNISLFYILKNSGVRFGLYELKI